MPHLATNYRSVIFGYRTLDVPVKEGSLQVAVKEDIQSLEEVVVTRYGLQREMSRTGSINHVEVGKTQKRPKKSLPVGHYKSFKQYIQENKFYTGKGKVVLIFAIDHQGRLENIRVKSNINEEAINLLKKRRTG